MTAELRTEGVTKSFGGVQALAGCTLTAPAGKITGLIGPNGSGKTTLFNVITGYERIDAGQVLLGDREITGARPHRVFALGVGRTFQLTRVFPRLTVLENMLVPAQRGLKGGQHRQRAMELLAFTGIANHAGALAGTLSYGQRKLLELAYVLIADPAVVLLDERRRGQPVPDPPHRRPDPRAQQGRPDLPDRRAQHGFRHGPVRPGDRAGFRERGGIRAAGPDPGRSPRPGCLPRHRGGRR